MAEENIVASLLSEDFIEGGAVPWDRNLTVTNARVVVMRYVTGGLSQVDWDTPTSKDSPVAVGLELTFEDDEGNPYNPQFYAAGDPGKLSPSVDGKKPANEGTQLIKNPNNKSEKWGIPKNSNLAMLLNEIQNAGYPATKIKSSTLVDLFDGLYGFWIGKEHTPPGSTKPKTISLLSKVERLPGEKKGKKGAAAASAVEASEEDIESGKKALIKLIKGALADEDVTSVSRAELSQMIADPEEEFTSEEQKVMGELLFGTIKGFKKAMSKAGLEMVGEKIQEES